MKLSDLTLSELKAIQNIFLSKYKEYYGIPGILYIRYNNQEDPCILWKGKEFSCYYVEDTMRERFVEDTNSEDEAEFAKYMFDNKDEVYYLCDLVVENLTNGTIRF
jgi:hypothetical protein